jgi:hypothetical protein
MGDVVLNGTLGQRILEIARRAVAVHLMQAAASPVIDSGKGRGQRVVIGRAGPQAVAGVRTADRSRDGRLPESQGELALDSSGPETEDDVSASPPSSSPSSSAEGAD